MNTHEYEILLFYKYVKVEDPVALMHEQRRLCEDLGIKGRIIIAHEGINATLEGTKENTQKYLDVFLADPRFEKTHIKRSKGIGDAFPRLSVKVRKDLVTDSLSWPLDPNVTTGTHLSPEALHELIEKDRDAIHIVDMRNEYEFWAGHFEGSILPSLKNFRDLPKVVDQELGHLKDKKVITVCTGGVRCEKASGYLIEQGFKDVYQLDGGIVSYMEKYPGKDFKGSLYVFDKRKTMHFNDPETHEVIGRCHLCGAASENYENCTLPTCHNHFICCLSCKEAQNGFNYCSASCREGKPVAA